MAQGQGGAWCKVGESGGGSESLLRQCQRFRFFFLIGLGEGCGVAVLPQHSRQEVASSCDRAQRHMSHSGAAGGSVSCRNIWQVGRSLVSLSPPARLHRGFCSSVSGCSGESTPRYCGTGFRLPHACSETILQL